MSQQTYSIEMHSDLPIMMTAFKSNFVFGEHALDYTKDVKAVLDAQESPVFYLFDLTTWNSMSLTDLFTAAAQAARGKGSNFHHPNNRGTVLVTTDASVSMAGQGLQSDVYGNANVKVFGNMEDAMAHIHSELNG